jgi:acyl-CoA reductase-like NAD-dependent aldehyde dehydrogenase
MIQMTMNSSGSVQLHHLDKLFIDGTWVTPSGPAAIDVINPATEEVAFTVPEAQAADMDRAIASARKAFDHGEWPRMPLSKRAEVLREIAAAFDDYQDQLGYLWTTETGVLHSIARGSAAGYRAIYNEHADMAASYPFIERHKPTAGGVAGFIVREPVGVVGIIVPWNGPMGLITHKLAPALLAGCTTVIKAAPEAPGAAYIMAEIAEKVGLPPGVINVVTADRVVSEMLVTDPRVDKISFTGSTAAGRRIASLCGARIARVTLELGGKSAAVILDDMDIGTAAQLIVPPACVLSGQACSSLTRIVVTRSRHDRMVEALSAVFSKVRVGDPFDPDSQMGPLAMERQRDRVEGYIAKGVAEGATLVTGGGRPPHLSRGYFIEPTVFGHVDNASTIAQEEIFGPVLSVIAADDENHAITIANNTIYGLNASVFTNDAERAFHVARQLRSGTVGHNSFRTDFGIAFGGFKQSGIGREGAREGLLPYLEAKTVILDEDMATPAL